MKSDKLLDGTRSNNNVWLDPLVCNVTHSLCPSKHFLFSKTSWRRLEDVFSVALFVFHLQYVFLKCLQDVFRTSSRRLQDVFARHLAIMSSRRLQDTLEDKKMLHWRRLEDAFKTSLVRLHQDECLLGHSVTGFTKHWFYK